MDAKELEAGGKSADGSVGGDQHALALPGVSGRKRGPYKKRDKSGDSTVKKTETPAIPLFNETNSGRVVALPFKLAAIRTDDPNLLLSDKEEAELGAGFALCANEWLKVDPKWVSLVLFSLSLSGVVGEKLALHSAWKLARERDAKAEPVKPSDEPKA